MIKLDQLYNECSEIIEQLGEYSLFVQLPSTTPAISKIRLRHRTKRDDLLDDAFDKAVYRLRQRALITTPLLDTIKLREGNEIFKVFVPNQYDFLYNEEVKNSEHEFGNILDSLSPIVGADESIAIASNLVADNYKSDNLQNALYLGAEILFYNIPYYYAINLKEPINGI